MKYLHKLESLQFSMELYVIYRERPVAPLSYENSRLRVNQEKAIDRWLNHLLKGPRKPTRGKRLRDASHLPLLYKKEPGFITELLECFDGKCPFCEVKLDEGSAEVFLFRPQYGALQERGGTPDKDHEDHYFWLIWEWSNLYPACESCVRSRGFLFPVDKKRAALGVREDDLLRREEPSLLDPCFDDPDDHLVFHEDGRVTGKSDRGEKTIEILDLNRGSLQATRKEAASALKALFREELRNLKPSSTGGQATRKLVDKVLAAHCGDNEPFAGMKRQLIKSEWKRWSKEPLDKPVPPVPPPHAAPEVRGAPGSSVSGGVYVDANIVTVDGDVVGRDKKIIQAGTYIEHATIIQSTEVVQESPVVPLPEGPD